MHETTQLISAIVPLAWPILAAVVLWRLFPTIKDIAGKRAFEVEAAGMKVSVQAAADQLNRDIAELKAQVSTLRDESPQAGPAQHPGSAPHDGMRHERPTILWVDDNPTNNAFETAQFQALGIDVLQAPSTQEALRLAGERREIRAVISDMGRREGIGYHRKAGLALLRSLREAGIAVPFIIYTSRRNLEQDNRDTLAAGGAGATASSTELLGWLRKTVA